MTLGAGGGPVYCFAPSWGACVKPVGKKAEILQSPLMASVIELLATLLS